MFHRKLRLWNDKEGSKTVKLHIKNKLKYYLTHATHNVHFVQLGTTETEHKPECILMKIILTMFQDTER